MNLGFPSTGFRSVLDSSLFKKASKLEAYGSLAHFPLTGSFQPNGS